MSTETKSTQGLEQAVNTVQNSSETQKEGLNALKNEDKKEQCKCSESGCACKKASQSQELEAKASEAELSNTEMEEKLEEYKDPITEEYIITRRNDVFFHEVYAYEVWAHKDKFFNSAIGF